LSRFLVYRGSVLGRFYCNMIINEQEKKNTIYNYTNHVPNIVPSTLLLTI